jgi:hypothetical protein
MSRSLLLRAASALGLAVLLGGLAVPLVGLVLEDERALFCCRKGRCCCADPAAGRDDRACLRRGCGCERPDEVVAGAPLRIEAVLSASAPPPTAPPADARWEAVVERPFAREDAPPAPPPRPSLPA